MLFNLTINKKWTSIKIAQTKEKEFMFCKNCGKELKEDEVYCSVCGFARDQGNRFCPNCGKEVSDPNASFCSSCGFKINDNQTYSSDPRYVNNNQSQGTKKGKSRLAAGLLQIFLGSFGIGRFYLGYTTIGVYQILVSIFTCGFGSLWGFIDGILILTGRLDTDAEGYPLSE